MAIRAHNQARVYLRCSSARQESSLATQLTWAIAAAAERGIRLHASLEDLGYMKSRRLSKYKDLYVDDAVSGTRSRRPGFDAMLQELKADRRISHLLVYKRDRLGRPRNAVHMVFVENALQEEGIVIVTSDGTIDPTATGLVRHAQSLMSIQGFYESGEFSRKLSERILLTHISLANKGYSTGGRAPYGFGRFLERPDGSFEEIPRGRRVKEKNCHVRFRVNDPQKIQTWIRILEWLESGWSVKRVANELNKLGIPTPSAGDRRHDDGVEHEVSGVWQDSTILAIAKNPIITGVKMYGRFAEGVHYRLGPKGIRPAEEDEVYKSGAGRIIENDPTICIRAESGGGVLFDAERWQRLQEDLESRGMSQRAKRRAADPAAYPLTSFVFDMTDGCGGVMHGVVRKDRGAGKPLYRCSIYTKTQGAKCHHNTVPAEALLLFTMTTLVRNLRLVGGPDRIRAAVEARLAQVTAEPMTADESLHDQIQARVQRLRQKVDQAPKRILEEDDDELRADLRIALRELKTELADAEKTLSEVGSRVPDRARGTDPETEVRNALALMDRIEAICSDPTARAELPGLFKELGIRIGLNFREGRRNSRAVRLVSGGIMAFGNRPLPCTLRNTNGRPLAGGLAPAAVDQAHHGSCCNGHREKHPGEAERSVGGKKAPSNRKGKSTEPSSVSRGGTPHSAVDSKPPRQPARPGRLYEASRGDTIRTCDLYVPNVAL